MVMSNVLSSRKNQINEQSSYVNTDNQTNIMTSYLEAVKNSPKSMKTLQTSFFILNCLPF